MIPASRSARSQASASAGVAEPRQHEVRLRRVGRNPGLRQRRRQRRPVAGVLAAAEGGVSGIAHGRLRRRQRRGREVERAADAVQHLDDVRRPVAPADPQAAEPVDLREGPGHHHVVARRDQPRVPVEALDELGIGAVEHQQRPRRQPRRQPLDLGRGDHGPGRVVGVGDEDQRRALAGRREDRVDVGPPLGLAHLDRRRAGGERADPVHPEAVLGMDDLGAGAGVGLRQEGDDLVRSGAADDARRVEAVHLADGGPERRVIARRVEVQARRPPPGRPRPPSATARTGSRSS